MRTVHNLLADYILTHELSEETTDYYRRMVSVLCVWAKRRVPLDCFTVDLVNRMLLEKQQAGLKSHYRKSLRSAMRALLGHADKLDGRLRPVRLDVLIIETWTAAEVRQIIDACAYMRDPKKRRWWQTLIACGYYLGFSNGDLWALRQDAIDATGLVIIKRLRTGVPVVRRIPEPWLAEVRAMSDGQGRIWGRPMAKETFRETFARIVGKAGLQGSFKKLRKTCGTAVEMLYPGRGHMALGNSRKVFEKHYFSRKQLDQNPMTPDELPPPPAS